MKEGVCPRYGLESEGGQWVRGAHKGSATKFDVPEYYTTLEKAAAIDGIIAKQSVIMDKYDPEARVGLFVDEWGTWFDVEEGTNPGFLHQQNTMRDAMVAAISLNIFHRHNRRVRMANIAQLARGEHRGSRHRFL